MNIVGVNGIRTHGTGNIDRLLLEMRDRGFRTVDVRLPKRHWFSARWGGCSDGQLVAQHSADGDIIVGHSFGCLRAWHAHQTRDYRAIVCIAPAMSQDSQWQHPARVHCYYSPDDWAVRFGSWLRLHPFGRAGVEGFTQRGVVNHRVEGAGHNDFFYGVRIRMIADYIAGLA